MNKQPQHINNNNVNTNAEVASWNRQRTSAELGEFVANLVARRQAVLETVNID